MASVIIALPLLWVHRNNSKKIFNEKMKGRMEAAFDHKGIPIDRMKSYSFYDSLFDHTCIVNYRTNSVDCVEGK